MIPRRPAMMWMALALTMLLGALGLAGCASAPMRIYVNPQTDMTMYQKIAMLPFVNLSGDAYAGARVTRAFTTELVLADRFKLVDPAEMMALLNRTGGMPDAAGQFDPAKVRDAANKLEATAYIRGGVSEYAMRHSGTEDFPVVSFDAEMVDVATGTVVWRVSLTESGKGRLAAVGGASERSFGAVTQAACKRAVDELRRKVL